MGRKGRPRVRPRPGPEIVAPTSNIGPPAPDSRKILLSVFAVSAAVVLCYANTLNNDFVHDDRVEILQNPLVQDPSNFSRIFTSAAWSFLSDTGDSVGSNYYRPVQYLTYFALYRIFGTAPKGYHVFKLLLHLGVCLLLFWIVLRFLADLPAALISSLFFAVHPANTEAVSWISGITDVTCALFFLLSFYFFLLDERKPSAGKLAAMNLFFLVGMFSKETAATFIPVLFAYQWLRGKLPSLRQAIRLYVPPLLLLLMYLVFRVHAIGSFTSQEQIRYQSLNGWQGILNQIVLLSQYFKTFFLPVNLNAHHVFDPVLSMADSRLWLAVLMLAGISVSFGYIARYSRARERALIVFGALMFVAALSPVLVFYQRIGENVFAERYLYLPAAGLVLSVAIPLTRIAPKPRFRAAVILAVLVLLSWRTIERNHVWANELVFYETTARASPAALIWNNLGTVYGQAGRIDDALKAYEASVAFLPNSDALGNLGRIYASLKRFSDSERAYLRAIEINPRNANHYSGLGDLYFSRQRFKEAIPMYQRSLEIRPNNVRVALNLADACRIEKRYDEAIAACRQVAALGPRQAKTAYRTMASIYAEQGLREKAAEAERMAESLPFPR